jgi:CRISPR-associated endonuclease/helicase Cas3
MDEARTRLYAHTLSHLPPERWELLEEHLETVGLLCQRFAAEFGGGEWGWIAGRCHDLGKASAKFQAFLHAHYRDRENAGEELSADRVDHSTFGARYVSSALSGPVGRLIAFCIAGHHAGLPNAFPVDDQKARSSLSYRLDPSYLIPEVIHPEIRLSLPNLKLKADTDERAFSVAFFTRMVFSCLIDADRICTEAFCDRDKAEERAALRPTLADLRMQLDAYLEEKQRNSPATLVNRKRRTILEQCLLSAAGRPGFYSLQVPTGGGKTLSSLAFALHHAAELMRRIVVAIPFTTIIEQTAETYRQALGSLGERAVVEHHTNLRPERSTRANQLATENWDAPLIVTTNVQLFESLFAAATTPCRKLHRLANSVIILDEAQTLPVELLEPTLRALRELVANYGCTVVLCTATQPALEHRRDFTIGLRGVTPIISESEELFRTMRRVQVKHIGKLTDDALAERLTDHEQVLCIVNTRTHAAKLFDLVSQQADGESVFHLSTLMCGEHRRQTLRTVRERLEEKLPCLVISTQLIEAGVDIDLPQVYRAAAGFDSIAQAAGRCNREGRASIGTTFVFDAEQPPPKGLLEQGASTARELWSMFEDPLMPAAIEQYFRLMYWKKSNVWDKYKIMECMKLDSNRPRDLYFQFRSIDERYKLIRDVQLPILTPCDRVGADLFYQLQNSVVDYVQHRKLQPYLVSVPERTIRELESNGVVKAHESGVWVLLRKDAYSLKKGLVLGSIGLDTSLWGV